MLFSAVAQATDPDPGRQRQLEHLLTHDCGSCHGMRLTGGLGPALTARAMSTRSVEALVQVISAGVPGTPMPPWSGILDQHEIRWLAERLRAGQRHE